MTKENKKTKEGDCKMINKNLSKRKESKFASKNSRGITLIALVVTIVVLIILATVASIQC